VMVEMFRIRSDEGFQTDSITSADMKPGLSQVSTRASLYRQGASVLHGCMPHKSSCRYHIRSAFRAYFPSASSRSMTF
jgi:hypothetical protein